MLCAIFACISNSMFVVGFCSGPFHESFLDFKVFHHGVVVLRLLLAAQPAWQIAFVDDRNELAADMQQPW